MTQLYASTFITGFQKIVERGLRRILPDVAITRIEDGIVLFTTHASRDRVRSIRFLNNTFAVVTLCERVSQREPLKQLIKAVREDEGLADKLRRVLPRKGWYTIMASLENQPTAIPPLQRQKLERKLSSACALALDRRAPTVEFWLLVRREGSAFFGVRLTRQEYATERGELRPELADLLCLLSDPSPQDKFLDPCCGSGAVPVERIKHWPSAEVWATDVDGCLIAKMKAKAHALKVPLKVGRYDACRLPTSWAGYFDKIVTDPPWGMYGAKALDLTRLLLELCRVTKRGGTIVLLLSRIQPFDALLNVQRDAVRLQQRYDVLVSGQKATAYTLKRL